eukprot:TRINITY_DN614_c0_g1_i2.p1 TRINITY_DN614_c0_g1~~TRINITY_DN614_c0_g1_i2.p1  ORF type:complete len:1061 (-),score=320.22 TRINITY_DN614_c0_g1_i2:108-2855(-)
MKKRQQEEFNRRVWTLQRLKHFKRNGNKKEFIALASINFHKLWENSMSVIQPLLTLNTIENVLLLPLKLDANECYASLAKSIVSDPESNISFELVTRVISTRMNSNSDIGRTFFDCGRLLSEGSKEQLIAFEKAKMACEVAIDEIRKKKGTVLDKTLYNKVLSEGQELLKKVISRWKRCLCQSYLQHMSSVLSHELKETLMNAESPSAMVRGILEAIPADVQELRNSGDAKAFDDLVIFVSRVCTLCGLDGGNICRELASDLLNSEGISSTTSSSSIFKYSFTEKAQNEEDNRILRIVCLLSIKALLPFWSDNSSELPSQILESSNQGVIDNVNASQHPNYTVINRLLALVVSKDSIKYRVRTRALRVAFLIGPSALLSVMYAEKIHIPVDRVSIRHLQVFLQHLFHYMFTEAAGLNTSQQQSLKDFIKKTDKTPMAQGMYMYYHEEEPTCHKAPILVNLMLDFEVKDINLWLGVSDLLLESNDGARVLMSVLAKLSNASWVLNEPRFGKLWQKMADYSEEIVDRYGGSTIVDDGLFGISVDDMNDNNNDDDEDGAIALLSSSSTSSKSSLSQSSSRSSQKDSKKRPSRQRLLSSTASGFVEPEFKPSMRMDYYAVDFTPKKPLIKRSRLSLSASFAPPIFDTPLPGSLVSDSISNNNIASRNDSLEMMDTYGTDNVKPTALQTQHFRLAVFFRHIVSLMYRSPCTSTLNLTSLLNKSLQCPMLHADCVRLTAFIQQDPSSLLEDDDNNSFMGSHVVEQVLKSHVKSADLFASLLSRLPPLSSIVSTTSPNVMNTYTKNLYDSMIDSWWLPSVGGIATLFGRLGLHSDAFMEYLSVKPPTISRPIILEILIYQRQFTEAIQFLKDSEGAEALITSQTFSNIFLKHLDEISDGNMDIKNRFEMCIDCVVGVGEQFS